MKMRKIRNCLQGIFNSLKNIKNMDSLILTSEASENISLFVFISSFVSFGVYIYICSGKSNFRQKISARVNQKKIKGS